MKRIKFTLTNIVPAAILLFIGCTSSHADSTSPRLAAYYDLKMLVCKDTAYQWTGKKHPQPIASDILQVGVGRDASYALTTSGELLTWDENQDKFREIHSEIKWFTAGRTGVFAARSNGNLLHLLKPKTWFGEGELTQPTVVSNSAIAASIGDSANYFIDNNGTLFVQGLAHRGQYGDGKLKQSETFIDVASNVVSIKAHTGHAILLKKDGTVMGTGGNIYGPVGKHGIGDKAIVWSPILQDAIAIATGSSHSLALKENGSLWHWGRDIGLEPKKIMDNVVAAAADQNSSLALLKDGTLWQWERDQNPKFHFQCK